MEQTKQQSRLVPIIMMMLLFAMISFVTNLAAPMGVVLKNQFGLDNWAGMLGNFMNFAAYLVMGIPAGILLSRKGYKVTALIAVAVGFIGVGVQYLSGRTDGGSEIFNLPLGFFVYLLGAFVAGFSMCMLNTVVNPMLNTLGGGGNKGNQFIQIGGALNSLTATITPMFVGALIGNAAKAQITDVFPVMYIAMGVFAVVFIVLAMVRIPEPHLVKADKNAPKVKDKYSAWSFRHFILGAVAISIYVGVEVGIPGILMLFLADPVAGLDATSAAATAGVVAGTYWFLMLIGRSVGGAIGGKVSSKTMLSVASGVALVLVLAAIFSPIATKVSMPVFQTGETGSISFGMAQVPVSAMLLVVCGLFTSIMWGGIFNLAVEGLGKYVTMASGIFMMMVCGGGILPAIQGAVADGAGYLTSYWVVFAGLAYLLYYALIGSRNVNKDIPVK